MVWAEFWPTADQAPAATPTVVEFGQIWRDMPKVVYSQTLERADWNATVVHDVVPAEVLVLGGADLAEEFARHGLIDEYRLYVHPMVIGRGTPMLRRSDAKVPLRLIETHTFGNRGRHVALRAASFGAAGTRFLKCTERQRVPFSLNHSTGRGTGNGARPSASRIETCRI
jgi:hypothetical protein